MLEPWPVLRAERRCLHPEINSQIILSVGDDFRDHGTHASQGGLAGTTVLHAAVPMPTVMVRWEGSTRSG